MNYFTSKIKFIRTHYLKNFTWMMVENVLRIFLGLTVSIYIIRFLEPRDYGILSYAVSLTGILSPIATLGIDAILLRNVINDKKKEKILLHTAKVLKLFSSAVLSLLTIIYSYFFIENRELFISIVILMTGIFFNSFNIYKEYIVSVNKMKLIAYAGIISLLISNFYRVGLIYFEASVIWFAVAIVLANLCNVLSLKYYYDKISEFQIKYFSPDVARKLLNDSWPLIFTSFTGTLFIYADQILIEFFFDFEEVGIYAAAVRIVIFFTVIPSVISNMIYPKIIDIYNNNSAKIFKIKMVEIYSFLLFLSVLTILFFFIFGEQFILILLGETYIDSILILKLYSISFIFIFFNPMNNKLLMIDNLQKLMLVRNFIGLVFNLSLNYYFIPLFGVVGAVYSTLISQALILLSYLFDNRTKYIFFIQIKSILFPIQFFKNLLK